MEAPASIIHRIVRTATLLVPVLTFTPSAWSDDALQHAASSNASVWGAPVSALVSAAQDPAQIKTMGLNTAEGSLKDMLQKSLWGDTPDWLKRVEWDATYDSYNGPQYNVLTTQPLWQSEGKKDTVFTQLSYEHYSLYDITRNTVNGGLGYRRLMLDNKLLVGVNAFYDYELSHDHARGGVGGDAKWGPLDFYANYYFRLNGPQTVDGAVERVDNGFDVGLGSTLPYLPWARIYGRLYQWDNVDTKNNTSGDFSGEFDLIPNLTLVVGTRGGDATNSRNNYAMLQFHFGNDNKPTLVSDPVSNQMFEPRDLSNDTLDKVRRENRIILERAVTSGGVTVQVLKG